AVDDVVDACTDQAPDEDPEEPVTDDLRVEATTPRLARAEPQRHADRHRVADAVPRDGDRPEGPDLGDGEGDRVGGDVDHPDEGGYRVPGQARLHCAAHGRVQPLAAHPGD